MRLFFCYILLLFYSPNGRFLVQETFYRGTSPLCSGEYFFSCFLIPDLDLYGTDMCYLFLFLYFIIDIVGQLTLLFAFRYNLLTPFFTLQGQAVGDICLTFCNQNRRKNLLFRWNIYWKLIKYLLRFSYLLPLREKIFLSPVQTGVSQQKFLAGFLRYSGLFCSSHHDAFSVV